MNDNDKILTDLLDIMNQKNTWVHEIEGEYEINENYREANIASKKAKQIEGMLVRLMKHLRATGEDVFVVLKDEELHRWWQGKLKEILKEEAKEAAIKRATELLSEDERRALGLKF